jgi:hypothetical protein
MLITGLSKWEVAVKMAKNCKWRCFKMGSGGQSGGYFLIAGLSNGKWWSKWHIIVIVAWLHGKWCSKWCMILIASVSKWEVVFKVVHYLIPALSKWEVVVKVVDKINCWYVKKGSGSQSSL